MAYNRSFNSGNIGGNFQQNVPYNHPQPPFHHQNQMPPQYSSGQPIQSGFNRNGPNIWNVTPHGPGNLQGPPPPHHHHPPPAHHHVGPPPSQQMSINPWINNNIPSTPNYRVGYQQPPMQKFPLDRDHLKPPMAMRMVVEIMLKSQMVNGRFFSLTESSSR